MTECLADLAVLSSALLRKAPRDCSAVLEKKKKKIAPSPWRQPRHERAGSPMRYLGAGPVLGAVGTVFCRWTYLSRGFVFCSAVVICPVSLLEAVAEPRGQAVTHTPL